jgi:hypothetical protein
MSELILKLFLAHVLGDFVFQKQTWVLDKERYNFKIVSGIIIKQILKAV